MIRWAAIATMRESALIALLAAILSACFATHEPPSIAFAHSTRPLALSLAAQYQSQERRTDMHPDVQRMLHELDIETERRFVEDLRATGLFLSVEPASATTRRPNLLAIRLPYEVDETAYCGEITVAPSILTAGLVPMRDCHRSYQIQFVNESTGATLSFQDTYSSDTWIGWIPIFMNFGEDWHWYGPPDDDLRIAYLRQDLSEIRSDLMRLAGVDDD
ncbi:MAG: hypothetical protein U0900_24225 [Myxococcota bacterium]